MSVDLQALCDGLALHAQREERAGRQLTLGGLIEALESMPEDATVANLKRAHSYRGYYCDLAFEKGEGTRPAKELLAECRDAMGKTFVGYKGGEYDMGARTPLWVASCGSCGDRLISVLPGGEISVEYGRE